MRNALQSFVDYFWPVRRNVNASGLSTYDYLRLLIVLAIVLLSGPEVFLAADMVAVLDLLGVALFLTAFAMGYRILGVAILTHIQRVLFPAEWISLIKTPNHPSLVTYGLLRVGMYVLLVTAVSLSVVLGALEVMRQIV